MQNLIREQSISHPLVQSAPQFYVSAMIALLLCGGLVQPALADEPVVNTGLMQLAQSDFSPTGLPNAVIAPPALPPRQNPYALADTLKIRGWTIPVPGAADTVDQGLFGLRNTLAQNGISYFGISATVFQDNLLRHQLPAADYFSPHGRENQLYNGQLPTYLTQNQFYVLYDLLQSKHWQRPQHPAELHNLFLRSILSALIGLDPAPGLACSGSRFAKAEL